MRVSDAPGRYIEYCKSTIASEVTLHGLKIVVDCAHGASYHIAPNVLRELGADVIEVGTDPNGLNINLNCGATHPLILQQQVLAHEADLGVALDGDGDRAVMVDQDGHILDGDEILYIIAKDRQERGMMDGGIVGTVMSNIGFESALRERGIEFVRVAVGDRHIMSELRKRGWHLGGEPSGHIVCLKTTSTGDGIITALQVLAAMRNQKKSLSEIRQGLMKYPQVLLNVQVHDKDSSIETPRIKKAVEEIEREMAGKGRVLLRRSGTEPLIRVMVEGEDEKRVRAYAAQLADLVKEEL
jgi:phosphoglucosamine mutase